MKICMIGSGYVGLVSGACFSDFGWDVTCVDKDVGKVESLLHQEFGLGTGDQSLRVDEKVEAKELTLAHDIGQRLSLGPTLDERLSRLDAEQAGEQ